jgi:hypothetical protein
MNTSGPRLIIQRDTAGGAVYKTHYSLDGITRKQGIRLKALGWKWIPGHGCRGIWNTTDYSEAARFASLPTWDTNTGKLTTLTPP